MVSIHARQKALRNDQAIPDQLLSLSCHPLVSM